MEPAPTFDTVHETGSRLSFLDIFEGSKKIQIFGSPKLIRDLDFSVRHELGSFVPDVAVRNWQEPMGTCRFFYARSK